MIFNVYPVKRSPDPSHSNYFPFSPMHFAYRKLKIIVLVSAEVVSKFVIFF